MEELIRLEQRVEQLVRINQQLREENQTLRDAQTQLHAERASLHEKNDLARAQIESIIARLKAMEQA